jgi:choline dehydrogenase-like flavoprotein
MNGPDFIVIGSGPAGVSAALPLAAAGRRVLMLDAGNDDADSPLPVVTRMLGGELEGLRPDDGLSPKLRTPQARQAMARFCAANNVRGKGFLPVGALARGGLSRVWGALAMEFAQEDFAHWPIRRDEMLASYGRVVDRIGVSGTRADAVGMALGEAGQLQPALPLGKASAMLLARHQPGGLQLGRARNAILSEALQDRPACDLRGTCLWGCPIGAIYDSRQDLARLRRFSNFHLADNACVTALAREGDVWRAQTADGRQFRAPRLLLAAGTLGSSRLAAPLLPPLADWPLLSNPVTATPLLVKAALGQPPAASHSLAQLVYFLRFGHDSRDYVSGALYETVGLPPSVFANRLPLGRRAGEALFGLLSPALLVAVTYYPGHFSHNRLHFDGNRLIVTGGVTNALEDQRKCTSGVLRRAWRERGAIVLPGGGLAPPGTDSHLAASLPMGGPAANATSAWGELRGHPGLYVVDGAVLPSLPSRHMTLTVMANADRIGTCLARM